VILFCLNLWGLFEITLPAPLMRFAGSGPREGLLGHIASGGFATLMATPCSAPFLGVAVSFALSQRPLAIFAVFTAIGIGMALPYLALAAAPRAASLLPKPGQWMETLRVIMGFLLAGAAVWLFYVLSSQVSAERLAFVELAILMLTLFVWLRHRVTKRRWAKIAATASIWASILLALTLAIGASGAGASTEQTESTSLVGWVPFDREEAERLSDAGELVFVDVTARWCVTCRVNEQLVLETSEIADVFARHEVIPMKADWTNRNAEIADYLSDHGRYAIPFYMLYRPGDEPFLFSELLNKEIVISTVESAAEKLKQYREELKGESDELETQDTETADPSENSPK